MGIGKTETSTTSSIPGMSANAARMQELLMQLGEGAAEQLGQAGPISTDPTTAQLQSIEQIQQRTGDVARSQMEAGLEMSSRQVEGNLLERGLEGSTVEAVGQALNQREHQRALNDFIATQAGQAGDMAVNSGFSNAQVQLSANQQLLNTLLGASGQIGQTNMQERLAQGTTEGVQDQGAFGALAGMGAQAAGMFMPGGGSTQPPVRRLAS